MARSQAVFFSRLVLLANKCTYHESVLEVIRGRGGLQWTLEYLHQLFIELHNFPR